MHAHFYSAAEGRSPLDSGPSGPSQQVRCLGQITFVENKSVPAAPLGRRKVAHQNCCRQQQYECAGVTEHGVPVTNGRVHGDARFEATRQTRLRNVLKLGVTSFEMATNHGSSGFVFVAVGFHPNNGQKTRWLCGPPAAQSTSVDCLNNEKHTDVALRRHTCLET